MSSNDFLISRAEIAIAQRLQELGERLDRVEQQLKMENVFALYSRPVKEEKPHESDKHLRVLLAKYPDEETRAAAIKEFLKAQREEEKKQKEEKEKEKFDMQEFIEKTQTIKIHKKEEGKENVGGIN
jgi:adenylate kinase family enzyme